MFSKMRCMILSCTFILLFSFLFATIPGKPVSAFSGQVIQKGATGTDVIELQARLQYIGYYRGPIDGVFSWNTYWALREFQKAFGLKKVDGLAGLKTRKMLVGFTDYDEDWVRTQIKEGKEFTYYGGMSLKKQTGPKKHPKKQPKKQQQKQQQKQPEKQQPKQPQQNQPNQNQAQPGQQKTGRLVREAQNVPEGYSQNDINLMANAVYGESRGEPYVGMVAVAAVILNRVSSSKFPNSVSGVIFQPGAFTAVSDGQIWLTPNKQAKKAVLDAMDDWDPSGGSIYYFNPDTATSDWIWGRPQVKKIGKHIYAK